MADRFMEFIRASIVSTNVGDAGVKSAEIQMPVSENENLAVLIHKVNFLFNAFLTADLGASSSGAARQTGLCTFPPKVHADMLVNTPGCLAMSILWWTQSASGDMTGEEGHREWDFNPPLLVAKRSLYVGAYRGTGLTTETSAMVSIGYTVEKVSKDAFIAALVGAR